MLSEDELNGIEGRDSIWLTFRAKEDRRALLAHIREMEGERDEARAKLWRIPPTEDGPGQTWRQLATDLDMQRMAVEYERDEALAEVAHAQNLLAVIHRDGGHYREQHGAEKAYADAERCVHDLRAEVARLREELSALSHLTAAEVAGELKESNHA